MSAPQGLSPHSRTPGSPLTALRGHFHAKGKRWQQSVRGTSLRGHQTQPEQNKLLQAVVELVFKFPPIWELAKQKVLHFEGLDSISWFHLAHANTTLTLMRERQESGIELFLVR